MRTRAFLATALAATLLTACGRTDAAIDEPAPSASTSAADPVPTPQVGAGDDDQGATRKVDPSGPYDLVPVRLRVVGRADGDRVVLTFRGRGTPGWSAQYGKRGVLDGSGRVVDLDGDTVLSIAVFGTPTRPADRLRQVPTKVGGGVADAYVAGAWEGVTQVFLGLEGGRTPYRISTLSSPSRLVVDFDARS